MKRPRLLFISLLFLALFIIPACEIQTSGDVAPTPDGQATAEAMIAAGIQQTLDAMPTVTVEVPTIPPSPPPTEIPPTETPSPSPTLTFTPTITPTATETLIPSITPTLPTPTPGSLEILATVAPMIANANILAYEDIKGYPALVPRLDMALNGLGLKGTVINTYDASGNFEAYLKSDYPWDLIIVSIENRDTPTRLGGLIWRDIFDHVVNRKGALIVETWYLSQIYGGPIRPLVDSCGIKTVGPWLRHTPYNDYAYVVYGLFPNDPFFNMPNKVTTPLRPTIYWGDDNAGDLVNLTEGSPATILGGLYQNDSSRYGTLVSCFEGRVIFQTFSTHDYREVDTYALWQNYIYNTLFNHFKALR